MKKYLFFTLLFLIVVSAATLALIFHAASPAMTHPPCDSTSPPLRGGVSRQTSAERQKTNYALFPDARSATELAEGEDDLGATLTPTLVRQAHHGVTRQGRGGNVIRLVTYNIGYASGQKNNVGNILSKQEVVRNLSEIIDSLKKMDADIIGLQEVDFSSARTFDIDQLRWIAESLSMPYIACVTTWNVTYLPWPYWPPALHYGRIVSGQAILSRFPIKTHDIIPFEKPKRNSFWYNLFYLDRVAQRVTLDLSGSEKGKSSIAVIWHTHLEAFDHAARREQAKSLAKLVNNDKTPFRWVLGDLNSYSLLRPDLSADERKQLEESDEALNILLQQTAMNNAEGDQPIYTMPSWDPVKKIDHILFAPSVVMKEVGSTPGITASDHLPVWADFEPP